MVDKHRAGFELGKMIQNIENDVEAIDFITYNMKIMKSELDHRMDRIIDETDKIMENLENV